MPLSSSNDFIIIGSGPNGLATAAYLSKAGQKVLLGGLNELMMGDKRTNIRFGSCGETDSIGLATGQL